jgi:methylenetetrahydrofolate reductase (NADPH)
LIVTKEKALQEILGFLAPHKRILIVGCEGCTTPTRGLREAKTYAMLVEMGGKLKNKELQCRPTTMEKQCDNYEAITNLSPQIQDADAILSLACGVGVQTVSEVFPNIPIYPAQDTIFLGSQDRDNSTMHEKCRACGECLLGETGGICPITRCAKSLLNGPCGGQVQGKCEAGGWKNDCAWILIYNRLKERNELDLFRKFRIPPDYRVSEHPRKLSMETSPEKKLKTETKEESVGNEKREAYSELMKQLGEGRFVFTGELEPMKTTNLDEVIESAKILKSHVVAINVTDNPTAFGFFNGLVSSYLVQRESGVEAVYQMTTRDRNRIALLSDILAAGTLGMKNILAITGDYTTVGDMPQAKPVFDLDSATLVYTLRKVINEGLDLNGNKIENPPKFNIGIGASPNSDPLEPEILKIERKVKLGVDFIQTQCVYSVEQAKHFMEAVSYLKTPVLLGIAPFKSQAMMDWMIKFVPGIKVPQEMEQRLRKAREKSKEAFLEENTEIFAKLIHDIHKTTNAAGLHLMAVGFEWILPKIIERSGIRHN